jgi:hypothetical protein
MPKNMLQESVEDLEGITALPCESCCDKKSSLSQFDQDSFDASINCEYQCTDKEKNQKIVRASFSTSELNMKRGNGNLWGLLSLNITYWSEETCLAEALKECEQIEDIQNLVVKSIQSGNWSLNSKLSCITSQAIASPLDQTYRKSLLKSSDIKRASLPVNLRFAWDERKLPTKDEPSSPACQRKIKVKRCYGDCISLDDKVTTEQLASPAPLGMDETEICADAFDAKLKGKKLTAAVKQHLCETYTMSEI